MEDFNNRGIWVQGMYKLSVLFSRFLCKSKTALKMKFTQEILWDTSQGLRFWNLIVATKDTHTHQPVFNVAEFYGISAIPLYNY